jgi:glucokinase
VLSGPGLVNLYQFLRDTGRGEEPPWLAAEMASRDPAAVISKNAISGRSQLCDRALDLFITLYGVEAGNTGLEFLAAGGVYIGGGIAPRNLEKIKEGLLLNAFLDKGRMRDVVEAMPVLVIRNQFTALLGAARCAALRGGVL